MNKKTKGRNKGRVSINAHDLLYKRVGMLEVIGYAGYTYDATRGGDRMRHWYSVKCDCGNVKTIRRSQLLNGGTRSCGCIKRKRKSLTRSEANDRLQ